MYANTENGVVELNWYEIGRVLTIANGTDYVYVGDIDIWPGTHAIELLYHLKIMELNVMAHRWTCSL